VAVWFSTIRRMCISADGDSFSVDGTLFTICPWWDGPVTMAKVGEQLARDAEKEKTRWAWLYHAPPAGSPTSWDGRRSYGDKELAQWIAEYRPDLVFSGHVHTSPFCQGGSWVDRIGTTWVFNAGYQIGPIPAYVVIDTKEDTIMWFSTARRELAVLGASPTHSVQKLAEVPAWFRASDQILGQSPD
jgi:hypothetical protein